MIGTSTVMLKSIIWIPVYLSIHKSSFLLQVLLEALLYFKNQFLHELRHGFIAEQYHAHHTQLHVTHTVPYILVRQPDFQEVYL